MRLSGGGLPTITDCTQIRALLSNLISGTASDDQLYAVTAPVPVPQGKHWIITNAGLMIPANAPYMLGAFFMVNGAAFGQLNNSAPGAAVPILTGLAASITALGSFLNSIQAIGLPTIPQGIDTVSPPVAALQTPFCVIPQGWLFAALFITSSVAAIDFSMQMGFTYLQRENNPDCQ
jgi:hypothetical protein